jgi:predicted nucleic acid-binding protein
VRLVLDASVALKWFFRAQPDEQDGDVASEILKAYAAGQIELLAPPHFEAEMCAVLAREAPDTMAEHLADLLDLAIPVRGDAAAYARAMQLSRDLDHHLFDTLYHAVALEAEDSLLVTADARYFAKASRSGGIQLLSRWSRDQTP